mgnify:CR=1 FL=1
MEAKRFVIIGIAVALVIAIAAPFLASSNPDGLESAFFSMYGAKPFMGSDLDEEAAAAAAVSYTHLTLPTSYSV